MSAYTFDPPARQGDTFTRTLTYLEDNQTTPINLTNCSVEWSLAPLSKGSPTLQFIDNANASITDPTNGEITLALTPTQTRVLTARAYAFEVTITFDDDSRLTILSGFLPVVEEVAA